MSYGVDFDPRWPTTSEGRRFRLVCSICGADLGDRPTDRKCCMTFMRRFVEPSDQMTLFAEDAA